MTRSDEHDVVIVGAGPAGSSSAYFLAKLGLDVRLLEAKTFPRPKPCGDGIGPRAINTLRDMGLGGWLESGRFYKVDRLRIISHQGNSVATKVPTTNRSAIYGYVLDRRLFDDKLARQAVSAGAVLVEGFNADMCVFEGDRAVGVSGSLNGKSTTVKAKLVVIADGSKGKLSRQLVPSRPNDKAVGLRAYAGKVGGLGHCANIYFSNRLPKGYGWVFPNGETTANVGVGTLEPRKAERIRQAFDQFLEGDLRPVTLSKKYVEAPAAGSLMKMSFGRQPVWLPGTSFVGDAAGLVSPINGEGISHALESGQLLAQCLDGRLGSRREIDKGLEGYGGAMTALFRSYFHWARILNKVLSNHNRMDRLIRKAQDDQYLATLLVGILSNVIHPREIVRYKSLRRLVF